MRSRRLLLFLVALALSIGLAEIVVRLLLPAPRYAFGDDPANQLDGLLQPDPRRGYVLTPGFEGEVERHGRRIRIAVNSAGLRGDELPSERTAPWILAVGDSFTVGFGVQAEEAWPQRLGAELRRSTGGAVVVANAAVSGYSLHQIRLGAEELVPRLRPDLLLVGVYADAVWRLENPYVLHGGRLINEATLPHLADAGDGYVYSAYDTPWLRNLHHWTGRHFLFAYHLLRVPPALANRLRKARRGPAGEAQTAQRLAPLLNELDRLAADLADGGPPWAVLLITPQATDGGFAAREVRGNRVVADHLTALGVPVVDPLPELQRAARQGAVLRFPDDHHWNERAHALAARVFADRLLTDGLWPPREGEAP